MLSHDHKLGIIQPWTVSLDKGKRNLHPRLIRRSDHGDRQLHTNKLTQLPPTLLNLTNAAIVDARTTKFLLFHGASREFGWANCATGDACGAISFAVALRE